MKRVLTAVVLVPLVILVIFVSPRWPLLLMGVIFVVAALALWEYLGLAAAMGAKTPRVVVIVCLAILLAAIVRRPDLIAPVTGSLSLALLIVCTFRSPVNRVLPDTAYSVFGLLYVGLSLATLYLLSAEDNGPSLLLFLFLVVWAGDIAALYIGRAFGRWSLAPTLSPNKTWEGALASVAASVAIAVLVVWLARTFSTHGIEYLSYPGSFLHWITLGIVAEHRRAGGRSGRICHQARRRRQGFRAPVAGAWRGARPHRRAAAGCAGAVVRSVSAAVLLVACP